ncbi:hypothetical protein QO010_002187 [Caulobacter ginsengisoli]|uniref:Uncharacterized protein n=1 Tax=Caulobacter ginsengisoli TaxID=400775 RepID=A0ABU0IQW5_9CAUL|nr:hypothetical protein [Caulobacter ginsengisoli]MDQ0464406.1 hypothetical protein [Caulobacter ginsengisoli]
MNLTIGRLVLDIPGLDADGARLLAERVGAGLAGLPINGARSLERLSVTLPPGAGVQAQAAAIVSAVRTQVGGGD